MSPFKSSVVKGGSNKVNEHVIDVDNLSPKPKRTRSPIGIFYQNYFRSYVASQNFEKYFMEASLLVERAVDQSSLHGLPQKIETFFYQLLRMLRRTW